MINIKSYQPVAQVIINKESYGRGMGNNKQIAAQVAAENALKAWQTKN